MGTGGRGFDGGGVGGEVLCGDSGSLSEADVTTESSRVFRTTATGLATDVSIVVLDALTTSVGGTGQPYRPSFATRAATEVGGPGRLVSPMTVDDLALLTQVSAPLVCRAVSYGEYCGNGDNAGVAFKTSGLVMAFDDCLGKRRGVRGVNVVFVGTVDVDVVLQSLTAGVAKKECLFCAVACDFCADLVVVGADLLFW